MGPGKLFFPRKLNDICFKDFCVFIGFSPHCPCDLKLMTSGTKLWSDWWVTPPFLQRNINAIAYCTFRTSGCFLKALNELHRCTFDWVSCCSKKNCLLKDCGYVTFTVIFVPMSAYPSLKIAVFHMISSLWCLDAEPQRTSGSLISVTHSSFRTFENCHAV